MKLFKGAICRVKPSYKGAASYKASSRSVKGQIMSEYVAGFEEIFNQLSAMGTELTHDMKIATFVASFGGKSRSSFGHVEQYCSRKTPLYPGNMSLRISYRSMKNRCGSPQQTMLEARGRSIQL